MIFELHTHANDKLQMTHVDIHLLLRSAITMQYVGLNHYVEIGFENRDKFPTNDNWITMILL